jgi:hypothetical protein
MRISLMNEIDAERALVDHRLDPARAGIRLRIIAEALTGAQHSADKCRELLIAAAGIVVAAIIALDTAVEQSKLAAP